jgi:hypothetical protein
MIKLIIKESENYEIDSTSSLDCIYLPFQFATPKLKDGKILKVYEECDDEDLNPTEIYFCTYESGDPNTEKVRGFYIHTYEKLWDFLNGLKENYRFTKRSNKRRFNEETNWSQVDQTARQVVRRALKDNDIEIMSEYDNELLSKTNTGDTDITIERIFTTDLSGDDMFGKRPANLNAAVKAIKSKLDYMDYSITCGINRKGNWEVRVSKIS